MMVQLPHPYMTIEKTIALTMQTFVSNVMFLRLQHISDEAQIHSQTYMSFSAKSQGLLLWDCGCLTFLI